MIFKKGTPIYGYEVDRDEGGVNTIYFNYLNAGFVPSLADSPLVMSKTVDALIESPNIAKIVFVQQRNYNYDVKETNYLIQIAQLSVHLTKQEKVLSMGKITASNQIDFAKRYDSMGFALMLLKQDPLACYFEISRQVREQKTRIEKSPPEGKIYELNYLATLEKFKSLLENCELIKDSQQYLDKYIFKDRSIYQNIFVADIVPNFAFTRLVSGIPPNAELIEQYKIASGSYDESNVMILKRKDDSKFFYHLMPPEYTLEENQHELLNLARNVLMEHQPRDEEYTDPERTRQVFFNISRDLIQELSNSKGIKLNFDDLNKMAKILVRHTIGFGLIEVLLQDPNIQDISLNAPISSNPAFVRLPIYDECVTNIYPSQEDADSWAAKFRMTSGRPLDEANPVLDTDLKIDNLRARAAIIQRPLSPYGLAFSLRRHREKPWTLSLFIKNKMIDSFSAGLINFFVDGARTILVAGTRSAGKTSFLGAMMLGILPKYRIISVEDTLELPVEEMRELGYDILRMKVRSSLSNVTTEMDASEGIRTSLRLGDSCLIMGEVRSKEAQALYEAMRVGALANVVAGTIHGASPYGVFDRVVNDLEIPVTSFKATDIIIVANVVKSPDGLSSFRRITRITEVRKHWTKDPLEEAGFVDLLKYNVETDKLEPTADLINGDSEVIKDIASNVRGWAGDWDAVWDNVLLRGKILQEIVDVAERENLPDLMESEFNSLASTMFHKISEEIMINSENNLPKSDLVFPAFQKWLMEEVKKRKLGEE